MDQGCKCRFEGFKFELAYNQAFLFTDAPSDAEIDQHIQNDDLVLFLISSDWIGLYDRYFAQLKLRKQQKKQKAISYLVDGFNWRGETVIKDAVLAGYLEAPKNLVTDNDRKVVLSSLDNLIQKITLTT